MVSVNGISSIEFQLKIPTLEGCMMRAALLLLVLAGSAVSADVTAKRTQDIIQYTDLGRTSFEEFTIPKHGDPGEWKAGNILPKRPIGTQKLDVSMLGVTGVITHDCSNKEFRCLSGEFHVFAVPRSGLVEASNYSIAGAVFHVDQCLRIIGKRCQIAILSSQCLYQFGEGACRLDIESDKSVPGPVMYFTFNEDFGVTSYGFAPSILNAVDDRFAVAGKLILRGDIGLLIE